MRGRNDFPAGGSRGSPGDNRTPRHTENDEPQPQVELAFGFLITK